MTLPANIRVNTSAPFPATVKANGPCTISKSLGIWTVGFSVNGMGQLPNGVNATQVELLVWNVVAAAWQITTLAALQAGAINTTTVTHAQSPYAPLAADLYLLVDTTGGAVEIDLTASASRNNVPLSIKDAKGNAATANITVKPNGAETVDGFTNASPLIINANYDGARLLPIAGGWSIEP